MSLLSAERIHHQKTCIIIDCASLNSPAINIQSERINDCTSMEWKIHNVKRDEVSSVNVSSSRHLQALRGKDKVKST